VAVPNSTANSLFLEKFLAKPALTAIIVDTLVATITSFTQVAATAEAPRLQTQREKRSFGAAAIIRLQGATLSLELFLGMPKDLTLEMAGTVFKQIITDLSVAQDLIGELLNIAFGTIDPMMAGQGIKMKSSFPQNFSGARLEALLTELPQECIVVPFKARAEDFLLEIYAPGSLSKKWTYTP
jgi:CheY-specific phosphatase CheX